MDCQQIGPYRIESLLGSGGMGTVYRAWDDRLHRWVAIKSISPSKALSFERRERLLREARAVAGCVHPAVTQVYDILNQDKRDFIIMEYVEGRSLTSLLVESALTIEKAIDIGRQIADGLQAAHEHGIVHRDLKAENIIVTETGQAKILDFGLAKRWDPADEEESLTEDGMVMGTSRAMSPEQAQGKKINHRSDLFALGSLLYEMVTGTHPFQHSTAIETMQRVIRHHPEPAGRLNPEVSEELELLIEHLLEKNPNHRPANATEVRTALEALESLYATSDDHHATLERLTASARQRRAPRWWWIAGGAALMLGVAATLAVVTLGRSGSRWTAVAVLDPVVVAFDTPSPDHLIGCALRAGLIDALASADLIDLLPCDAVDCAGNSIFEIATAVGATEVLLAHIEIHSDGYTATVSRSDVHGRVLGSHKAAVSGHALGGLYAAGRDAVDSLFPGSSRRSSVDPGWGSTPEVFARLLDIRERAWKAQADSRRLLLDELLPLLDSAPAMMPAAYITAADLAIGACHDARDPALRTVALELARTARRLDPSDPRSARALFEAELEAGNLAAASEALAALGTSVPERELLTMKAELALEAGDHDAARTAIRCLVSRCPTAPAYAQAARLFAGIHDLDAAIDAATKACELSPRDRGMRLSLARLELCCGDPSNAAAHFQAADDGRSSKVTADRAMALILAGQPGAALTVAEAGLELRPEDTQLLVRTAQCLDLLGHRERAEATMRRALEGAEGSSEVAEVGLLALAHAYQGQREQAAQLIQRALAGDPSDRVTITAALVYALIGDRTAARLHAQQALDRGFSGSWLALPWLASIGKDLGVAANDRAHNE